MSVFPRKSCEFSHDVNTLAVEAKDLCFAYDKVDVIKNANFRIPQKSFTTIVGGNGVGKSTLLKLIMGLIKPDSGIITVMNHNPANQGYHMSYVPQHNRFNTSFPGTVFEVVSTGLYSKLGFFKFLNASQKKQAEQALETVGMGKYRNTMIGELSGGEQQRVFVAKALLENAEIMILDEPTVGIDKETTASICQLLKKLQVEQEITILMVTHDSDSIKGYAELSLEMQQSGEIIAHCDL